MSSPDLPLVSIVIPNYNYGRFIAEAIESVLNQTYPNIELIVVDDGSSDDSLEAIRQYEKKLILISQKNSGVVVARNSGAARSRGEYISFLDADDVIEPAFIEKLIQPFLKWENITTAISYCDTEYFGQDSAIVKASEWNVRKLLYRNYIIPAALIKCDVFDLLGGFSKEVNQKSSFEDWDLWLSVAEAGYSGAYIPEPLFRYRYHGEGRNVAALKMRSKLESILRQRHPKLYKDPINRLYLAVMGNASKLRGKIIKPPGT